ncbi:MAG: hypothetical protein V3T05_02355, partial [Myxococcota bacterium]
SLSDELTATVRLGLLSATAAAALARLQRCNQDEVAQVVTRRGLTSRQTAQLVQRLLAVPPEKRPELLAQTSAPVPPTTKGGTVRRSPAEQLVADAWAMKRLATRMHARLLERSLASLGEAAAALVSGELAELRKTLRALSNTLETRLGERGSVDGD